MENVSNDGSGYDPVTAAETDVSADTFNLEWLFDPERVDHLPIEDQLKMYRCRDLRQSKLFRFGIGLWDTLPSRKRRLVAPPMAVSDDDNHGNGTISPWSVRYM
jgi:hypothetical protein